MRTTFVLAAIIAACTAACVHDSDCEFGYCNEQKECKLWISSGKTRRSRTGDCSRDEDCKIGFCNDKNECKPWQNEGHRCDNSSKKCAQDFECKSKRCERIKPSHDKFQSRYITEDFWDEQAVCHKADDCRSCSSQKGCSWAWQYKSCVLSTMSFCDSRPGRCATETQQCTGSSYSYDSHQEDEPTNGGFNPLLLALTLGSSNGASENRQDAGDNVNRPESTDNNAALALILATGLLGRRDRDRQRHRFGTAFSFYKICSETRTHQIVCFSRLLTCLSVHPDRFGDGPNRFEGQSSGNAEHDHEDRETVEATQ